MREGWWWWGVLVVVAGLALRLLWRTRRTPERGVYDQALVDPLRVDSRIPRDYSPKNVGNDASARPWEVAPAEAGTLASPDPWPAGFDAEAFLQASKANFLGLQQAWDRGDVASLRAMMTDTMLQQLQSELEERERVSPGASSQTDVLMFDAQLLGVEDQGDAYVASVEFSGMSREHAAAGPSPFREVWNITRPKSGEGAWLVAGVQALQ